MPLPPRPAPECDTSLFAFALPCSGLGGRRAYRLPAAFAGSTCPRHVRAGDVQMAHNPREPQRKMGEKFAADDIACGLQFHGCPSRETLDKSPQSCGNPLRQTALRWLAQVRGALSPNFHAPELLAPALVRGRCASTTCGTRRRACCPRPAWILSLCSASAGTPTCGSQRRRTATCWQNTLRRRPPS